ncbi:phosphotransferase [Pandoraea sputorum]|uniref:aminoglycoside phosphotransferase family protein n=1 Tax=Pandoraea sputorum TaxID=93222 RepID=UPI001E65398E|nr:aminoglycoside phosphotransferase family protein [Pandoraea sputorum]MCE4062357.1 phosphotransferase [Pandoraea sputorum]
MLDDYIRRWGLVPDAEPILTATGCLLPVLYRGQPAMLKLAVCEEERRGNDVMAWWDGDGAARVLARCDDAVVLERACSAYSLVDLSRTERDDDAMRIACAVLNRLHSHNAIQRPAVVPLGAWFEPLTVSSWPDDHLLHLSAATAKDLLSAPLMDEVVLHGDIHHGNILHFGERGWLAIDPKGLLGDRAFDYANLLCNPSHGIAVDRFSRRVSILVDASGIDRRRLLQWTLAWSGLSALWMIEDGLSPETRLCIAALAATELQLL